MEHFRERDRHVIYRRYPRGPFKTNKFKCIHYIISNVKRRAYKDLLTYFLLSSIAIFVHHLCLNFHQCYYSGKLHWEEKQMKFLAAIFDERNLSKKKVEVVENFVVVRMEDWVTSVAPWLFIKVFIELRFVVFFRNRSHD